MKPPAKGASKEQLIAYNAELRRVILQEGAKTDVGKDKDKAPTFFDAKNNMVQLNEELFTVANWVSIDKNAVNSSANPINVFDKLVASKVNWDSQGYYARLAFRTELKCTILSAFSYLAVFYNYEVPLMNKAQRPLIESVAEALKQIDARPAGISPEQVRESNGKGKDFKLYSPTLGVTIKKSRKVKAGRDYGSAKNDIGDGYIAVYAAKSMLRGGRWNDLELAGLEVDNDQNFQGIGFGCEEKCNESMRKTDRYLDQREGWKTKKVWTNILMNNATMPSKLLTSTERWELFENNGPRKETKVEDLKLYPFTIYWFDRA